MKRLAASIVVALGLLAGVVFARDARDAASPLPRVMFRVRRVDLRSSTVVIEPLQATAFVATWFDGDLKQLPREHAVWHCQPSDFQHAGGHYTRLECDDGSNPVGAVFVKTVLFAGEGK